MSNKRKRNANFKPFESRTLNSRYVRITESMLKSKAWKELDPYEHSAYLSFKLKYFERRTDGSDNRKNISLTYEEMKPVMSPDRFKKCIDNLIKYGFIDIVEHRPQTRNATIYGFSDRWHKYGTDDFKEHQRVRLSRRKKDT